MSNDFDNNHIDDVVVDLLIKKALNYEMNILMNTLPNEDEINDVEVPEELFSKIQKAIKEQDKSNVINNSQFLEKSTNRNKNIPIKKLITILVALFIFMIGSLSVSAFRVYFMKSIVYIKNGSVNIFSYNNEDIINLNNVEETEEIKAYKDITKIGIRAIRPVYLPYKMAYDNVRINELVNRAEVKYSNSDSDYYLKITMAYNNRPAVQGVTIDGELISTELVSVVGKDAQLMQIKLYQDSYLYYLEWVEDNSEYSIFTNVADIDEMKKIINSLAYYK